MTNQAIIINHIQVFERIHNIRIRCRILDYFESMDRPVPAHWRVAESPS